MSQSSPEIHVIRHGETAWTESRQHTGLSNIRRAQARAIRPKQVENMLAARKSTALHFSKTTFNELTKNSIIQIQAKKRFSQRRKDNIP
jgi:broad specificity phosphatase PhoE